MAIHLRLFETENEFVSAYTGDEYIEPWTSYVENTQEVAYDKPYIIGIEIKNLKMVGTVPASGGTVNKDNCTYVVNVVYNNMSRVDITDSATVVGSLVVPSSQIERRHSAGTLTLVATYDEFDATASVSVWQDAFVPSVTGI